MIEKRKEQKARLAFCKTIYTPEMKLLMSREFKNARLAIGYAGKDEPATGR